MSEYKINKIIPYGRQCIDDHDIEAVISVLKSDYLTQGPALLKFEEDISKLTGAKYCVGVSNATAGLHLAVAALGIEQNLEGITSPITFLASSNSLVYNGLIPVFADIDPGTYNISPDRIREKISGKTRLIIPVHFAGQACEMKEINKIAASNNLYIIEDAAHAIGSLYNDGTPVGNCKYSDMTIFSFHPVKTITTGEGGVITTNNEKLYRRLLLLRSHGMIKDPALLSQNPGPWYYEMQSLGYNYRITDIQAALGSSQLKKLSMFKSRRKEIINKYNVEFSELEHVTIPYEAEGLDSCFHLYVLQIDFIKLNISRTQFMEDLKNNGVMTQVHYIPVHTQPYYAINYNYRRGDYPVAESYYEKAISLPLFPGMTDNDTDYVVQMVKKFLKKK